MQQPLRVLHTEEIESVRQRIKGQWVTKVETHSWYWATTIEQARCPARWIWYAGHHRWDIENDLFNTLGTNWSLNHCFKHEPTAILNFILTLFVTFILLQSFFQRNLKPSFRAQLTLLTLAGKLYQALASGGPRVPWYDLLARADTS